MLGDHVFTLDLGMIELVDPLEGRREASVEKVAIESNQSTLLIEATSGNRLKITEHTVQEEQ